MSKYYDALSRREAFEELQKFPLLDVEKCEEQANSLFKPYLFFRRGKEDIELHCSRCRTSGRMDYLPRQVTTTEQMILEGKHNQMAVCPYCGKEATLKEMRYLGRRVSLCEYKPVVFMDERNGELFAQCFWARKDYLESLTAAPLFMQTLAIRFTIGRVTVYEEFGGKLHRKIIEGNYNKKSYITEPFSNDSYHPMGLSYMPYTVFGREAIKKSENYRYCQYEQYRTAGETDGVMMRYLAIYSIYPRQTEMLMKSGMSELVTDLIYEKKKNARILKWDAPDMRSAFGLDGQEMRAFRDSGASVYTIGDYKVLKRAGVRTEFSTLRRLWNEMGWSGQHREFMEMCAKERIKPDKLWRYVLRYEKGRGRIGAWFLWRDYFRMAKELGYDLEEETVRFPKDLERRHDEAVKEMNLRRKRIEREMEAAAVAAAQKSLARRRKKYNFRLGGYFIRIAEDAAEIRREGKTLQHCVGGYAERHLANKTTILFLRREETPEASLYTVEMDKDDLRQIHGYRNNWPQKDMAWFLEPWLAWLKAGSRRDKKGEPIIPDIREKKEAKTA